MTHCRHTQRRKTKGSKRKRKRNVSSFEWHDLRLIAEREILDFDVLSSRMKTKDKDRLITWLQEERGRSDQFQHITHHLLFHVLQTLKLDGYGTSYRSGQ